MPEPALTAGVVTWKRELAGENTLKYTARHMRPAHTGVHALIEAYHNGIQIDYDTLNMDKRDQRLRFSNGVHRALGDLKRVDGADYSQNAAKFDFDTFCRDAWALWTRQFEAVKVSGDVLGNPLTFLARPHVIEGAGTILFGAKEQAKSAIGIAMAIAVNSGVNGYWDTKQAPAMFVNLERSARSIQRRIGAINQALGLEAERELLTINARGRSLTDLEQPLQNSIREHGVEFMVIDSISRSGIGDLNENQAANLFADLLNSLDVGWLAIGHTGRVDQSHVFGSIHFDNAADLIVKQVASKRDDGVLGVQLSMTKANDIERANPMYLALSFDQHGVHTIEPASPTDFPDLEADEERPLKEQIFRYLRDEAGQADTTAVAQALGINRSTASGYLNADERLQKHKKGTISLFSVRYESSS